ncbi:AMP-binding enzyme family protein (macronuclear) [Tetrahymena thermophila SB210]|uniref:AMP-binding enzyme family protein n=1 Tax=Tetrahymena thermophila (strain SB210) TaxID=312017 RepID=Q23MQ2_TETTS|nr:AMP-binding enzyme family protein [Tetrahymena thermophila SB210]EAR97790.2 AMP-binding enzyme family protein [Tetrahymena thermophila SB210]|eukprot:XP_001018035.2 AMP-binding enzyme family protein [Tetrahymena thermophila SB210]
MLYSKLDLFSSQFTFYIGNEQTKRGTLFGILLSLSIIVLACAYLIYMIWQFFTNQIEPTFRSQSFITEDKIDIPLSSSMVGFRFEQGQDSGNQEIQQNKTYLVYIAYLYYNSPSFSSFIPLNVTKCTDPNLQGFNCLDFSNVSNYTLSLSTKNNLKSSIEVFTYGCLDLDSLKTTIPDNCATQSEIDSVINGVNAVLKFKLFTSQYNTTSQEIQVNYRNAIVYTVANQAILTQLKTQKQVTQIKQGLVVQSNSVFSSPIQYVQQDQGYDRQYAIQQIKAGAYSTVIIYLDEIVQQIQIQYPTLPQIFALVNSTFNLLMLLGIFGRFASQKSINKDFCMLFLKNLYQDDFLKIIKQNNCEQQFQQDRAQSNINNHQEFDSVKDRVNEDLQENYSQPIFIPAFANKQKALLDQDQTLNTNEITIESQNNKTTEQLQKYNDQYQFKEEVNQKQEFDKIYAEQLIIQKKAENSYKQSQSFNNSNLKQQIAYGSPINQITISQKDQSLINSNNISFTNKQVIIKKNHFFYQLAKTQQNHQNNQKNYLKHNKFTQILEKINNRSTSDKFSNILFKMNLFRKCDPPIKQQKDLTLSIIEEQVKKDLNILNFVKDIIFLKKAVMMLLTKDQLAALHLLGFSSNFLHTEPYKSNCSLAQIEKDKKLSHYEMQYSILKSPKFQIEYFQQFLKRCSEEEQNTSNLDQRILTSIVQNYKI